ncbi:uncharacterized protein LOC126716169 [Quercus robur]|uniref:uncharacterized protein LOC126716169 n=1 Tax=Quercus robur TaxID=38942 RepID=UPI0021615323|nr:uncharacterized protein LOC126716169 [Quercus robur]
MRTSFSHGLGFKGMVFFLGVALICSRVVEGKTFSKQKVLEVERKINHLRRHALKSIKSADGDIIDCIDIYKQPAFDHPALMNHTIQMTPSYDPTETKTRTKWDEKHSSMTVTSQLWQKSGSCPKGTIPKAVLITEGYSYSGAKGDIKVWNPNVEADDEYSTSQICLSNGPYYNFESIESGWAVNPSIYGDRQTRLFVYWTADASKTTGCFDLTCPGFVQTSDIIALGAAIYPISLPGGLPYQITIYIFKDPSTGNWWVQYGEKINIGYWPPDLFKSLSFHAETVDWGGEVYSSKLQHAPHTATAMGNGNFPLPYLCNSGCITRMRIHDNSPTLKFPDWVETYTDEYNCYDVMYVGDYIEDPEFFYGGPGRNYICP